MTVVEVGWKHVAEGLRRRVAEMNSKSEELTGYIQRVGELTQRNEGLQQHIQQIEEEKLAMMAQWGMLEQQRTAMMASHGEEVEMLKTEIASLQVMLENPEEGRKMLQETITLKEKECIELTRTVDSLHAQLASLREEIHRSKKEHESVVATMTAQVRETREAERIGIYMRAFIIIHY